MTDLSQYSDAELERAAGVAPANPDPAPMAASAPGPYDHMTDAELEKAAGGHAPEPPKPSAPQMGGFWRDPAMAASNFAKGAVEGIPSAAEFLFGSDPNKKITMADMGPGLADEIQLRAMQDETAGRPKRTTQQIIDNINDDILELSKDMNESLGC